MNIALIHKAQAIFEDAVELPAHQRDAFVRQQCDADPELLAITGELVRNYQALPAYNDSLAEDIILEVLADQPDDDSPRLPDDETDKLEHLLDGYRLIEKIGEGGMGAVYLATQQGDDFEQRVAIKILRGGLDSEIAQDRFRQERQILAQLDHPAITRLIDGGSLPDQRPYLVMAYTPGVPITIHCQQQSLSLDARLGLMIQLCDALTHAHQNLVIHRDIKPANILVDDSGALHLLDFGIAKLEQEGQFDTRTGMMVMTPDYASPEQVAGQRVTVASDVYALGVLLYELLTGTRPYNWRDHSPAEFERLIHQSTPVAPSQNPGSDSDSAHERLAGLNRELDNIVLKALHSDPLERYRSVADLGDDLQRYLNGEPVHAHPPGALYRTRKFIGRHRLAVSALTGLFVLTAAFGLYSLNQARALERQRDQALQESQRAEQVTDFLLDAFANANPTRTVGVTVTAEEILESSRRAIQNDVQLHPETSARLTLAIANAYYGIGSYEQSLDLLLPLSEQPLSDSIADRHRFQLAQTLSEIGRHADAMSQIDARFTAPPDHRIDEFSIRALALKSHLHERLDQPDDGLKLIQQLHDSTLKAYQNPNSQISDELLLQSCLSLSRALWKNQRSPEGIPLLEQCHQRYVAQAAAPDLWLMSRVKMQLAILNNTGGDLLEAYRLINEACDLRQSIYDPQHIALASCYTNRGANLHQRGLYQDAISSYQQSIDIYRNRLGEQSPAIGSLMLNQALSHWYLEELDATESRLVDARALFLAANMHDSHNLAIVEEYLGILLHDRGELDRAETHARESVRIYLALNFSRGTMLARARVTLAEIYLKQGHHEMARTTLELAQPAIEEHLAHDTGLNDKISQLANQIKETSS